MADIHACSAVGVVFGHLCAGPYSRYSDGCLIRTSDIQSMTKEGKKRELHPDVLPITVRHSRLHSHVSRGSQA